MLSPVRWANTQSAREGTFTFGAQGRALVADAAKSLHEHGVIFESLAPLEQTPEKLVIAARRQFELLANRFFFGSDVLTPATLEVEDRTLKIGQAGRGCFRFRMRELRHNSTVTPRHPPSLTPLQPRPERIADCQDFFISTQHIGIRGDVGGVRFFF